MLVILTERAHEAIVSFLSIYFYFRISLFHFFTSLTHFFGLRSDESNSSPL